MPYSSAYVKQPPIAKYMQRVALIGTYVALLICGLVAITILETPWMDAFGWVLAASSCVAIFGVITGLYRFEWSALPFVNTSTLAMAILLWVGTDFAKFLLIGIALYSTYRFIHLWIVAKTTRELNITQKDVDSYL